MASYLMASRRRALALATAVVVVFALVLWTRDRAGAGVEPSGEGISVVYLAVGTNFPDALGAGPLAAANGAPILLVTTNPPIPPAIAAELERLDPERVVIVGGTGVISQAMEDAVAALLPNATVDRLAGGDRYITSALLSESVFPITGFVSVPGIAFSSQTPATDSVNLEPGDVYGSVPLYAPINLPQGAEIVAMSAYVTDTDGADGIGVRLKGLSFNTDVLIADVFSGDAYSNGQLTTGTNDITEAHSVVANDLLSYYLEVYASGPNRSLIMVIVTFEIGSTG